MAIFGIGAHQSEQDVTDQFIARGLACVGWSEQDAPPAHSILRQLRAGDLIFIKSFTPRGGLAIKAVGIVMKGEVQRHGELGSCVPVQWVWTGREDIGRLNDKWPVRSVTIYEEHHPKVQAKVIDLLLSK